MLSIYCPEASQRLRYVVAVLFEEIIGLPTEIVDDREHLNLESPLLNYSDEHISNCPFIRPAGLLEAKGLEFSIPEMTSGGICFPVSSDVAKQDVFSASFLLLSRYEEYLTEERDAHGRYSATQSMQQQAGLLEQPLVDQWALALFDRLQQRYPSLARSPKPFQIIATFDIDIAYAYKGRGAMRTKAAEIKDRLKGNAERVAERKATLSGMQPDPYDTYAYQRELIGRNDVECRHFFLLGDKGPYDNNLSHEHIEMRNLIQEVSSWSVVGIHPSMGSHDRSGQVAVECKRLQAIINAPIKKARMHFLKFKLPETYHRLIEQDIEEEYSMGYADAVGFRAGTCTPHAWYDLSREESTTLRVYPITAMDSTLKDYMGLSIDEAKAKLQSLKTAVAEVDGCMITLFHNTTVANYGEWNGWRTVLESILKK